jgi:hypothetical protein
MDGLQKESPTILRMFMALGLMSAAADPGHDFELGSVKIGPL